MKNLKVKIELSSPAMIDRYLTIDSILLGLWYRLKAQKNGKSDFVDGVDNVDFLDKKNGVLSGSIWYIEEDADLSFDFVTFCKKPETKEIFLSGVTKTKHKEGGGEFKAGLFTEEVMLVKSVYFYVRGDKDYITKLLSHLKFIGKKGSQGFGIVKNVYVGETAEDLGHTLTDTTPSKPLPCCDFDVKTKKVAFYRTCPPYWANYGLVPCYMPSTSLIESVDNTWSKKELSCSYDANMEYLSNVSFIREIVKKTNNRDFELDFDMRSGMKDDRKKRWVSQVDGEPLQCSILGTKHRSGYIGNPFVVLAQISPAFSDQAFVGRTEFLSEDLVWSMRESQIRNIGNTLISNDGIKYMAGKQKDESDYLPHFLMNHTNTSLPFSLNLKTTSNNQHVGFKGKVALSNALFPVQFGSKTLYVDGDALISAVKEMLDIVVNSKIHGIGKSQLTGMWSGKDSKYPDIKNLVKTEESVFIVDMFRKKYDSSIRQLLYSINEKVISEVLSGK